MSAIVAFDVGLSVAGSVPQSSPSLHGKQSTPGWQHTSVGCGVAEATEDYVFDTGAGVGLCLRRARCCFG